MAEPTSSTTDIGVGPREQKSGSDDVGLTIVEVFAEYLGKWEAR